MTSVITPRHALIAGIASLLAWAFLILVRQVPSGLANGLYAVAILLIVRWLALRP